MTPPFDALRLATEFRDLLVEISRWSRVAERNGDLHARIASALARFESGLESSAAATAVGERQGRQPAQKSSPFQFPTSMAVRPTCPNSRCATSCEPDALYCVECGARLYTLESGRYGERT